jgi:hypothetical protein
MGARVLTSRMRSLTRQVVRSGSFADRAGPSRAALTMERVSGTRGATLAVLNAADLSERRGLLI